MSSYNPDGECPKCGHGVVTTNYHEGCAHKSCGRCHAHECKGTSTEHLSRHCTRCHFEWVEAVLGAIK